MGFGEWLPCSDGRVHYLLGGVPLCGKAVPPTGEPAPLNRIKNGHDGRGRPTKGSYVDTSRDCAECERLNVERWAARPVPRVPAAG